MNRKQFIRWWGKNGAGICTLIIIIGIVIDVYLLIAISMLLMLSVPCSLKWVNSNTYWWLIRQTLLIILAGINMYGYVKDIL